ncbi:MAG: TIGR03545 family protein [Planctomycetales bacterium]
MRWSYLLPRLVVAAAVWAFFAFAFDPLLRRGAVAAAEAALGTKVDVAELGTWFFPPAVSLSGVQVADPADRRANLVQFETLRLELAGRPLLVKSFVIEEGAIDGLEWGTPRTTAGTLDPRRPPRGRKPRSAAGEAFGAMADRLGEAGQDWMDDLVARTAADLDPRRLESVRLAKSLDKRWRKRFQALEARLETLESRVREIERGTKDAGKDPLARIEAYARAADEVQSLLKETEQIRKELQRLPKAGQVDLARLEEARQRDLDALKHKLDFLSLDAEAISKKLLGPELSQRLAEAGAWIDVVRRYARAAIDAPRPVRMRGVDVEFDRSEPLPAFLVKRLRVGGKVKLAGETIPFRSLITGLTSDPALHGEPVVAKLVGAGKGELRLLAVLDYRGETSRHDATITWTLAEPVVVDFGDADDLVLAVRAERTEWAAEIHLQGDALTGGMRFVQSPVSIASRTGPRVRPEIGRVIAAALGDVRELAADVTLAGTLRSPEWTVRSDLGEQLRTGLHRFAATEAAARRDQLRQMADALIQTRSAEFQQLLGDRHRAVLAQLDADESQVRALIDKVAGGKAGGKNPLDKLPLDAGKLDLFRR